MPNSHVLSIHDLRFAYGARTILSGVDLDVRTGEAVAITGPSGVGKTTLLSLLGGLLHPVSGTLDLNGRPFSRQQVSWILQTVNVLPHRTALDNVALGARTDGLSWHDATRIAQQRLAEVGLAPLALTPARRLSGGELQRVVIARCLASQRPFILADEPTGQLDRATTDTVSRCLLAARAERGIILVTHDTVVAHQCDRVYQLLDGRLQAETVVSS